MVRKEGDKDENMTLPRSDRDTCPDCEGKCGTTTKSEVGCTIVYGWKNCETCKGIGEVDR